MDTQRVCANVCECVRMCACVSFEIELCDGALDSCGPKMFIDTNTVAMLALYQLAVFVGAVLRGFNTGLGSG